MREWEEDIFRVPSYLFQSKSHAERGGFSRASEIPAVFKEKFEDLKNPKQKDIWLPGFLKKAMTLERDCKVDLDLPFHERKDSFHF